MTVSPTSQPHCRLTLPNDLGYIPAALAFIQQLSAHFGFSEADRRRIELAVEEAATNVIEHAFSRDETSYFDIYCRNIAAGIEICIHDKGIPWDPKLEEDYHPDVDLDNQSGKGLGRHLIQHLMDEYTFENLGHDGKQIKLVKYLNSLHVSEESPIKHGLSPATPPTTPAEPVEIEVRRMQPHEAIEVARVVFDCYGYSYAGEFMYYPERIAAMNANGDLLSAVAVVRATGEIAGHSALLFSDALPAELAVVATKEKFRGMRVARRLGDFLTEEARKLGLSGIYVKEVTVHPYTQQFCQKLGFRECGFLLAHSPKSLAFKGIADEGKQRNSNLLGFKTFVTADEHLLYPPQQHAEIIMRLYDTLSIPARRLTSDAEPRPGEITSMTASVNSGRALCEIQITHYGTDVIWVLRHELRRARRNEVQLIEMYLSLNDACTPWVAEQAQKLGFFFTGVLPNTRIGDAIIMQLFNGIAVEYSTLKLASQDAKMLLDYIKPLDPTMV